MPKGFTVRLDDEQAEELEAIAEVDGVSVAEEIRQAIGDRIAERRKDTEFSSACGSRSRTTRRSSSAWLAEWPGTPSTWPTSC